MAATVSFDAFLSSLSDLGRLAREDATMQALIEAMVVELRKVGSPSRENLARFVEQHPQAVPVLATCVGLTQEQLKNQLYHQFRTTGWVALARKQSHELIRTFDEEFNLVARLTEQIDREWSFSDVLLERYLWSRRGAASAIRQGRSVEDEVEEIVRQTGIRFQVRTRFTGRSSDSAPCDLAIPMGGEQAQIVVAMKGFNSTGSKLSDAVREIETMASVRLPNQYVYAVVDGIGWKSRQADLRRIYNLWDRRSIDGLYTLIQLDRFQTDLQAAARRLGLLPEPLSGP